jgi:hypothetical protein
MNYDAYLELYKDEAIVLSPDEEMADYLNNYSNIPTDEELEEQYQQIYGEDK